MRRNSRVLNRSGASIQSNSPLLDWREVLLPVPSNRFGICVQKSRSGRLIAKRTGAAKVLRTTRRPKLNTMEKKKKIIMIAMKRPIYNTKSSASIMAIFRSGFPQMSVLPRLRSRVGGTLCDIYHPCLEIM